MGAGKGAAVFGYGNAGVSVAGIVWCTYGGFVLPNPCKSYIFFFVYSIQLMVICGNKCPITNYCFTQTY